MLFKGQMLDETSSDCQVSTFTASKFFCSGGLFPDNLLSAAISSTCLTCQPRNNPGKARGNVSTGCIETINHTTSTYTQHSEHNSEHNTLNTTLRMQHSEHNSERSTVNATLHTQHYKRNTLNPILRMQHYKHNIPKTKHCKNKNPLNATLPVPDLLCDL